jgi:hypothetical protein
MTCAKFRELAGDDRRDEFPHLHAVHFVIYSYLGPGFSSTTNLGILGKGFADYIRSMGVDVPELVLERIVPKPTLPLDLTI